MECETESINKGGAIIMIEVIIIVVVVVVVRKIIILFIEQLFSTKHIRSTLRVLFLILYSPIR